MEEQIESGVAEVVSQKRILLRHPGGRRLTDSFYPNEAKVGTNLAEATNSRGRYRVTGNSLSFASGSTTNFTISTSSIINNWELHATITLPANRAMNHGWLAQALQQIEVTFSNSLMQSVQISGLALREYLLYTCESVDQRKQLLDQMGRATPAAGGTFHASMPIGNLLISALGQASTFGLDQSTLSGPIQVTCRWAGPGAISTNIGANAAAIVSTWDKLELTCDTTEIISSMFSVRNALQYNPGSSYNIPAKYLNSVRLPVAAINPAAGVEQVININSCPAGMLEAIILTIKPNSEYLTAASNAAANSTYFPIGGSVNLSTLRLTYAGQDLFRSDSPEEIRANYRSCFGGDVLNYVQRSHDYTTPAGPMNPDINEYDGQIIVLPMMLDGKRVARQHLTENLSSYSGASLELRFTIDPAFQRTTYLAAAPFAGVGQNVVGSGGATNFTVEACFVMSALLEISNGVVDLSL